MKKKARKGVNEAHPINSHDEEKPALEVQQLLLGVFKTSLADRFDEKLSSSIRQVKSHLFNRDFHKAFGDEDSLEAYSVRWSSSRALGYLDLLCGVPQLLDVLRGDTALRGVQGSHVQDASNPEPVVVTKSDPTELVITCLGGGGGAEIVAIAACLHHLQRWPIGDTLMESDHRDTGRAENSARSRARPVLIRVLDMADWSLVLQKLYAGLTSAPPLPQYTSPKSRDQRSPLIDPRTFTVSFNQYDVLSLGVEPITLTLQDTELITLTFTLNELYATSMSRTTSLLLTLTYLTAPGTLLLVVDSPGSYSTVQVGITATTSSSGSEKEKKYPMKWLLDHTLLEASSIETSKNVSRGGQQWERVGGSDSTWFRLPKGLRYPVELEDMRYQWHLYRRI
ncbi:hypothetical protein MMC19_004404 [Ptychographa xylographoides]|nr:hypothetical protein [Ptychographa xylographoides]